MTLFAFLVAGLFLIVQLASIMVGVSMTRTITGAVHELYEGTQKVMEGDFSHRIEVTGKDQLAEVGHSFNRMTENLEVLRIEKDSPPRTSLYQEAELQKRDIKRQIAASILAPVCDQWTPLSANKTRRSPL